MFYSINGMWEMFYILNYNNVIRMSKDLITKTTRLV